MKFAESEIAAISWNPRVSSYVGYGDVETVLEIADPYIEAAKRAVVTDVLQRMIDEAPFELPARLIDRDSEWTCYPSDVQAFIRTYLPAPTASEGAETE